ncbi:MAG: hypothetical protein ABIV94_07400, partial [Acidimicrobiales bacterium]
LVGPVAADLTNRLSEATDRLADLERRHDLGANWLAEHPEVSQRLAVLEAAVRPEIAARVRDLNRTRHAKREIDPPDLGMSIEL